MTKSKILSSWQRFVAWVAVLLCVSSSQVSCLSKLRELEARRAQAEVELETLCQNIPVPSNFSSTKSYRSVDIREVTIFRNFTSTASCATVKDYFFNYFISQGWNQQQMTVEQSRGGMATLGFIFRQNDYVVWVSCQNDIGAEKVKQIGVSCSWGLRK